jgi:hypothetical protein
MPNKFQEGTFFNAGSHTQRVGF